MAGSVKSKIAARANPHGFVFSLDSAASVTILVAAMFMLVALQGHSTMSPSAQSAIASDALYALEGSGYLAATIDSNSPSQAAGLIRSRLAGFLSAGYDKNVAVRVFGVARAACNSGRNFPSCFPDANISSGTAGSAAPSGASFASGRHIGAVYGTGAQGGFTQRIYVVEYYVWGIGG